MSGHLVFLLESERFRRRVCVALNHETDGLADCDAYLKSPSTSPTGKPSQPRSTRNGLPEPHSDDPTQWLFKGDIATSTDPLQVAVARLLGYRWPDQPKDRRRRRSARRRGRHRLPAVAARQASAPPPNGSLDLLRAVYTTHHANDTKPDTRTNPEASIDACRSSDSWLTALFGGKPPDDFLRDKFFEEHCKRFHQRPFIWHIWDGRKDGFAALVNYHKLTHKTLENLTYSYLGDWITAQSKSDKVGADLRLAAAQALQEKLKLILAGEPPYDIFVRWKPLHEQAIGWHPDLNDGVRMNIRPFATATVPSGTKQVPILRVLPNIKWTKDRGKEPERDKDDYPWFWPGGTFTGDRVNDIHLTGGEKTAARQKKESP